MGRLGEFLVLISVFIVMFGWRKLPGIGASFGKSLKGFKEGLEGQEEERPSREVKELGSAPETTKTIAEKDSDKVR